VSGNARPHERDVGAPPMNDMARDPVDAERPLAAASRRLRRPAGRPRSVRAPGPPVHGSTTTPAPETAIRSDFAASLPHLDWPQGLSIPLASRYSGVPIRRLWALVAAGVLPVVRIPGMRAVLVLRDDLDALLLAHRKGATP
jgi:hypothetical protein